jgi:Txe/YoeB family toxin of Txe-Axe toxin-antitoxin module
MEEADKISRQKINEEKIREIVQMIPDEWLKWEGTNEAPEQLRSVYFTFLTRRLNHSNQFIKEVQDAAKILI